MRIQLRFFIPLLSAASLVAVSVHAHSGSHASVHDTVAGIIERLKRTLPPQELVSLTAARAQEFLTPQERIVLSTEHLRFKVNVPAVITLLRESSLGSEPFWISERGFEKSGGAHRMQNREFDCWQQIFSPGEIGLGVPSLSGNGVHYLVLVQSLNPEEANKLEISDLYPGHLRVDRFVSGIAPFVDQQLVLTEVPPSLNGQWVVKVDSGSTQVAKLVNVFNQTRFPAGARPDHVVLTWGADPKTSQTLQWRTSTATPRSFARVQERSSALKDVPQATIHRARTDTLSSPTLVNDPEILRHTVTVKNLRPGTTYRYSVGDGSAEGWTEPMEFTTAPKGENPFSFVYMGDAQNGLDSWGELLRKAHNARPDAAFYLMAGDLVNRGAERWDWDAFFEYSGDVFKQRPIVPVIGNHECQGGAPLLYLRQFELRRNGPRKVTPERAYSFDYSNARFIILDSNLDPQSQADWLEQQLADSVATWKIVSYHHPAYSAAPNRENHRLRQIWTPLFDRYHVDLVLQGHDHSYLRTYPLRSGQQVSSAKEGTIYVVSVSGTKFYEQGAHDYAEVGITKLSTYQVLDIQIEGKSLRYRAHDANGNVRDEFVIQK